MRIDNAPARALVHHRRGPVQIFDEIKLLVLEIIQRHRLPVEKHRQDLEIGKDLEFVFPDAATQVLAMEHKQMAKTIDGLISPKHHIAGPGIEPGLEEL